MVPRRALLALLGSALGGCLLSESPASETPTEPNSRTPAASPHGDDTDQPPDPNTPPDEWPPAEWTPDWSHTVPATHVVGLDVVDGRLIITAHDNHRNTVVQAYDTESRSVAWSNEFSGGAVDGSIRQRPHGIRHWGVTHAGGTLLSVTGGGRTHDWTALHAIDSETGDERWSLRRERSLAVRGVVDDTLVVVARAFEETATEHHHGSETPTPEPRAADLLAIDLSDGTVQWTRDLTGIGAVAADDTGVYVAVMNRLLGLDLDGTRRWRVQGDARGKAIFPHSEIVYHVAQPEWNRTVVHGIDHGGDVHWQREFTADESVRYGDRLYVAGEQLSAVRPDGTLEWRSPDSASRLHFSPSGEEVYVRTGTRADAVGAVGLGDGSRQWLFDPPINNAWPESATNGTVVAGGIGAIGHPLYRIDAASGEATGRYLDEDTITTQPVGDHLFVGIGRYEEGGQVLALPL